ncbi:hypothetical protein [Nonomuraea jabiensis]|uniref:MFS transporter n=1 Tax=Nonomuraea jabiensis TaxID=882448 RepID=A0A7W9GFD5_9ACTN|nr:hypothetical protein [Nonomuraea jabiensis]MBB5782571.1 hypothetical protein [Nonomuraea jabiensis]
MDSVPLVMIGPPGLGFLGDHWGLRTAMLAVPAFVASAVFLAPAVETRRRAATVRHGGPGDAPMDVNRSVPGRSLW